MTIVTFDPERVDQLRRALLEVDQQLERCRPAWTNLGSGGDIIRLILAAQEILGQQITRVEEALSAMHSSHDRARQRCDQVGRAVEHAVDHAVSLYRTWSRTTPHWWTLATTTDSTASDDLLRRFACTDEPAWAGRLIDSLPDLELLTLGTADMSLVEDVWTAATHPSTTPPLVAGERIERLLAVVFDERPWERGLAGGAIDPVARSRRDIELHDMAARIVAPWQLHFSRADSPWRWSGSDGARRLHQLSQLESASDSLMSGLPRALRLSLDSLPDDPSRRITHIDSVAQAVGTSLEVRRMSQIDRAQATSDLDDLRNLVGALALDGPWPISLIVDAGARWIGDYFDTSDVRIRQAALETLSQREVLASLAVLTVFTSAMTRMLPSRNRSRALDPKFKENLTSELRHTYQSIDNAAGRGQVLAQLTSDR